MDQLTTSQEQQAASIAYAMSEKFELDFDNFDVVQSFSGPKSQLTVAYVARLGIYLGSWDEVKGPIRSPVPEHDFVIAVGEDIFDTRHGMTEAVYRAMINTDRNNHNPDRPIRKAGGGIIFPQTWLTGESAKPHWAPVGQVDIVEDGSKRVNRLGMRRNSTSGIRFRPAVSL
jgi:hypothetical protein